MTEEQKRLLSGMLKDYMPDDIDYTQIYKSLMQMVNLFL